MGAAALQCSAVCRIVGKLGRQLKNFARSPNSVVCVVWAWQLGWAEVWDILNNLRVAIFKCVIKHSAVMDTVKTKVLFN